MFIHDRADSLNDMEITGLHVRAYPIAHRARVKINDHFGPSFMIIEEPVNLRPEHLEIVRPEWRTTC